MEKAFDSTKKFKKYMILGPVFKVIEVIFELITPFLMKYIVDTGLTNAIQYGNYNHIIIPGCLMILFALAGYGTTFVCQYFASIASQGSGTDLRNRVYRKIMSLSTIDLEKLDKGNLMNILTNDVNRIQTVIALLIRLVVRAPVLVVGSLVCAALIDWKISLIYLAIIPLVVAIYFIILKVSSKQYLKVQKENDKIVTKANDDINGIRVIKAFNNENKEIDEYKVLTDNYYKESKVAIFVNELINPLTMLIVNVAIIGVLLLSSYIITGSVDPSQSSLLKGDVVALISYLNQILLALIVVCNLIVAFTKGFASNTRINNLLNYEPTVKNTGTIKDIKIENGDNLIELKDVSVSYSGENYVVSNINFKIDKGQTVGVIGGTGAGKTTIIKLIERFLDASKGEIIYKGHDIKDYDLISLRNEVSLVDQKASLMNGTIKSNILMGKSDASDEEVIEALKKSKAYDFVSSYEDGINHPVRENGRNFSGGQRQRLSIARSLIKESELLILDDSTSALDYLTDKEVRANIKEMNKTTLIISQRVSSLSGCDVIYVMDHGKIVDSGTNDYLMNNCEIYKEIYESQVRNK